VTVELATLMPLWKGGEVLRGLKIELSAKGDEHRFFLGGDGFGGNRGSHPSVKYFFEAPTPNSQPSGNEEKAWNRNPRRLILEVRGEVNGIGLMN
jgi:hypothetical protein